jgi:hypothetical protein
MDSDTDYEDIDTKEWENDNDLDITDDHVFIIDFIITL